MPTRAFNGGTAADRIITSAGNAPAVQGPITVAALVKITSGFGGTAWIVDADSGTFQSWGMLTSGGPLFYDNDFNGGPTPTTGAWLWVVGSKPVGASLPRWHVKNVTTGGAWSHSNGGGNVNDLTNAATEIIIGGQYTGGASTTFRGSMAALAAWPKVLTDLEVEAYCTLLAKDLRLAEPSWGVLLNQASTATSVTDFTGWGGNQSSLSGTSVDSDVPPGWDDSLPTVQHLFTNQTPAGNFFENSPTTLATTIKFSSTGQVTGGGFRAPASPAGTYELVLWRCTQEDVAGGTGVVLATAAFNQVIKPSAWNYVAFSSPVSVDTTHMYKIGIRSTLGSYTATGAFFSTSETVNGNITGIQAGVLYPGLGSFYNGSFDGTITGYPATQFNQTCYFIDVSFVADAAPSAGASPSGLAVPVNLGNPTVALGLSATPGGLAVPVALGQPAAALGLSAAPAGLAIPVALGQPTVGQTGVSPNGLAIPVAIGQPTVALGRVASPAGLAIPVALGQPSTLPPGEEGGRGFPILATTNKPPIITTTGVGRLTA